MCGRNLLNELLNRLTAHSKKIFGDKLINVVLYGSYARGDWDDESDIDVMILVDMPTEELRGYRKDITHFCSELNVENGVFISPKLQSAQVFEQWKEIVPFYRNVAREGLSVYG